MLVFRRVKNNIGFIITRFTAIMSLVFGAMSIIQIFVDWDVFGVKKEDIKSKITVLCIIVLLCFIVAVLWAINSSKSNTIYSCDEVKIIVKYGDLMKIAFPKRHRKTKIVVIAVNRCFDTIVNQDLIKAESVHGQFLSKYVSNENLRQALDQEIERSLKESGYQFESLTRKEKKYGKLKRYPLGAVARINGSNGVVFFLIALTTFDCNCVAHCTKSDYFNCLLKLFDYYNIHGQGNELYLYAMGSNMARTGLTKIETLESTVVVTKVMKDQLKTCTTIIVNKKDKNEIPISGLR